MAEPGASALVCDIQRFSVHDGPGIRTNVYFKGCSLNCQWCHNPETISFENQLLVREHLCVHCGDCMEVCPRSAISLAGGKLRVDYSACDNCLLCTEVCPAEALVPSARSYDVDSLLGEITGESEFYGSEGGLTISGGEPLMQVSFLRELLPKVREAGIHITVETAGHWSYDAVSDVLDQIDLILFDLKLMDPRKHEEFVGRPNARIIENFGRCIADGRDIVARMPVVPGVNDDIANVRAVSELLQQAGLSEIVLLPYHTAGKAKAGYIGKTTPTGPADPLSKSQLSTVKEWFHSCGIKTAAA